MAKRSVKKSASTRSSSRSRKSEIQPADNGDVDPVATIVAQWRRERPDLDPAPMRLFGLLARSQTRTSGFMNRILADWDLTRPSFDVLAALRRAGPPYSLTPKALSQSLMLSGAGMTSRLDRLEALHLISRLPEFDDRRSLKIQLTDRGVRLIEEIVPVIVNAQWRVASKLGTKETNDLVVLLHALEECLSADVAAPSD